MNPLFIPIYQLYLLQLENYELGRYWTLLFQKGYFFSKTPLRKTIVWTQKTVSIFGLAFLFYVGCAWVSYFLLGTIPACISLALGFCLFPIFYTVASICLLPIDFLVKQFFITKAKRMLSSSDVKIIGIAGSYGKTTMKSVLLSVLSTKLQVIATPESVNTPIGIAQWLVRTLKKETDVAVIEYGEHYKGDIAGLCEVFPPDIAVLTGINEAHLERLKTLGTSIATMFEIVEHAKPHAHIILNADDEHIKSSYKIYEKDKQVFFYSSINDPLSQMRVSKRVFDEEKLRWTCVIEGVGTVTIPLLGEYAIGDCLAALMVGKILGLTNEDMKKGLIGIKPVPHRLEPIQGKGDVLVIDDSYNGNPDGVSEAIRVLARFKKRRKVFITPGLVEIGSKTASIHERIGRELAGVADRVILIKNSVTSFIEKGLNSEKFDETHIIWFNTAEEAHASLSSVVQAHDVVLFQNDWGDQYI